MYGFLNLLHFSCDELVRNERGSHLGADPGGTTANVLIGAREAAEVVGADEKSRSPACGFFSFV